jgi:hypothetical protein
LFLTYQGWVIMECFYVCYYVCVKLTYFQVSMHHDMVIPFVFTFLILCSDMNLWERTSSFVDNALGFWFMGAFWIFFHISVQIICKIITLLWLFLYCGYEWIIKCMFCYNFQGLCLKFSGNGFQKFDSEQNQKGPHPILFDNWTIKSCIQT